MMPLNLSAMEIRKQFPANLKLFTLLVLITVTVTTLYVSSERNFHWWLDWHNRAIEVATAYRESPSKAIQQVLLSLGEERNKIYTVPLVPFILTFGKSRLVYELSLALVYLLPFSLVMGAISTRIILAHPQRVFWSTALITLLIPVSWVPTFMGIPDTGGALLIGLAALVYLHDVKLKQWWRIPLIGFLIASAILLRRHFVYGGIAFLFAAALQALIFFSAEVGQHPHRAWQKLLLAGMRISLIAATSLTTLLIVAWEFTYRAMTTDYSGLYTSWSLPFSSIFTLYACFYGWVTWLIVAIGFSGGILTRTVALPAVIFIGLLGIFSSIEWLVLLRYGNIFYSLHITPLVVIGLSAGSWTAWLKLNRIRTLMLGMLGCYLTSNLIFGLTTIGTFDNFLRPLFALSIPPLVRADYDEVVRLVSYLRQLAPNQESIYVVGNQRLQLTSTLVKAAEKMIYGQNSRLLNILAVPQVDSRDAYPIETLLQAQYVVVPNSLPNYPDSPIKVPAVGEWLPNKEHDVVKVVFDAFTQNWEFAQDFQRLPTEFFLEGGSIVNIYRRVRPSSLETTVRTLYVMQQRIGETPGGQLDWLIMTQPLKNVVVSKNADNTYKLVTLFSNFLKNIYTSHQHTKEQATSYIYLGSLPKKVEVTGKIIFMDNHCLGVSLRLAMLNKEGDTISSTEKQYLPENSSRFKLYIRGQNADYLLLEMLSYNKNGLINSCNIEINSLAVLAQKF